MRHTTKPRALWFIRAARGCVAALAVAVLAAAPAAARAAPAGTAWSRAQIYQALGVDNQPADYVILVDTSGSMQQNGRYDTVRSSLLPFLRGMSPNDHVALFTFDSRPQPRYIGSAANPEAIVSDLPAGPNPSGDTDIGAALDAGLSELERDNASAVASVVLLTDGEQHPPAGSRYPQSTGPAWTALHDRAQAIAKRTVLAGYALPLGDGASGADLLGTVVQDTTVLRPGSIQDLGSYLARAGEATRVRKTRLLLAGDAGKGVTAAWSSGRLDLTSGSATGRLTLRSTTSHLPLTVTGVTAALDDPPVALSGLPAQLTLRPGQARTFTVRLSGRLSPGPLPYRRLLRTDATVRVSGQVASPWQPALAPDVPLKVPPGIQVTQAEAPLQAEVGSSAFLPAVLGGAAAAALAVWLWWRRSRRPLLSGTLLLVPVYAEQPPEPAELRGRRVALRPQSVGGRGRVHGRRRVADGRPRVDLLIRYTPDGSTARQSDVVCGPGGEVVVGGVRFTHLPARPDGGALPR